MFREGILVYILADVSHVNVPEYMNAYSFVLAFLCHYFGKNCEMQMSVWWQEKYFKRNLSQDGTDNIRLILNQCGRTNIKI